MKLSAWKESKEIPVIYGIHNVITNKWYIGSCYNMKNRLYRHYYNLTHNSHHSPKLQRSWNKYGEDNFEVLILKTLSSGEIEDMFNIEEYFIKDFDSKNNGYNILDTCKHVGPFHLYKEAAEKAGKTHNKPVVAIDRYTGEFVKKYSSITEAAKDVHTSTSNISRVCLHFLRYMKGFVFLYEEDYDPSQNYAVPLHHMKGVAKSEEVKMKMRQHSSRAKKVYKYDLTNNLIGTYMSRSDAERQNNMAKEYLRHHLNETINGYIYTYEIKDIV